MSGTVRETYHAAIQHDLVDLKDATLVGVVRRPTGWFRATVDENHPPLGPPDPLLDAVKSRAEELAEAGLGDAEATNTAWEHVDFEDRYRTYLTESDVAGEHVDSLLDRVDNGETIALVCYEADDKRFDILPPLKG